MAKKDDKDDKKLTLIDGVKSAQIKDTLSAQKTVSELFPSGMWTPVQLILQEIQANLKLEEVLGAKPTNFKKQVELLKKEINDRYEDNEELRNVLLQSVPAYRRVSKWTKTLDWEKAVWSIIQGHEAFNNKNKLSLIMMLFQKGMEKQDVRAADLFFKLSGELTAPAKEGAKSKAQKDFEDIQKALHSKK
jgi:hypothetical protein